MLRRSIARPSAAASALAYCNEHLNPGVGRTHHLVLDRGEGSYVFDLDNKKYLDFACGIGVTNLGHCHPRLVAAAKAQLDKAWHLQVCLGPHSALHRLLHDLESVFPPSLNSFSWVTTGAEAVEAAMKLSRAATGRQNTCVLQGSYHGRTVGAASMTTSKYGYARGLRPLMPGVTVIPVPYTSQMHVESTANVDEMVDRALAQANDLLHQTTHPSEVSMLIAEPVLGEGGYLPLPKRYYKGLRDLCTKHGILFCIDEVQTGFGRTGTNFMFEQLVDKDASGKLVEADLPDIVCFAKGIANGIPIAGIVSRKETAAKQISGQQGGTYSANPIACATASEVIKILKDEGILKNVEDRSKQAIDGLKAFIEKESLPVMEVRGRGLMVAMQFDSSCPEGTAQKVANATTERGLLVLPTSKFETLRIIPPLNVTAQQMDEGISKLCDSLKAVLPKRASTGIAFKPCCPQGKQCNAARGPCRHVVVSK